MAVAVAQAAPVAHSGRGDGYLALRAAAEIYEDVQRTRIAVENRVRTAPVDAELVMAHLAGLRQSEHDLALFLRRTMRRAAPDLVAWQRVTVGIGEHLLARLLGQIGHPVLTTVHGWEGTGAERRLVAVATKRRRVSDLWSYCGHGDPARRRHRGMTVEDAFALGNSHAKPLVWNIANAAITFVGEPDKNGNPRPRSPYRDVYDQRRMDTAERVHAAPCVRCGPSGKPAPEGSPWSAGHQHADALRVVGKEILRDLWLAAGGAS